MSRLDTNRRPRSSAAPSGGADCATAADRSPWAEPAADPPVHEIQFLHDLAVIMLAAGVVTVVFHLLRQPVVLGYIAAGVLIGPHTFRYASLVTDQPTISTLSDLGLVFLLFSLGLEFSLRHLRQVGATALVSAIAGIVTMLSLGYALGR